MDLFTFTQKILNEKFRFLCSESRIMLIQHPRRCKPSRKQIFNIFMFLKNYFRAYFPLMCLRKISIEITIFEINENVALTFSRKVFFAKSLHKHWSFSIKDIFSKCDQIRRKLRIWSHFLRKSILENFIFCAVNLASGMLHNSHLRFMNSCFCTTVNSVKTHDDAEILPTR